MNEWGKVKGGAAMEILSWVTSVEQRLYIGRRLLGYLGRVMDGEMPPGIDEWRDLWVQAYQLTTIIQTGFLSLRYQLDQIPVASYTI